MKNNRVLLASLVLLACAGAYWAGRGGRAPAPEPAAPPEQVVDGLAVASAALEFGEIWEQREFARDLTLRNQTEREIVVERFGVSCSSCLRVEPQSLRVAPGGTATVTVKLDLTQRSLGDFGKSSRTLGSAFWPIVEGGTLPGRWADRAWQIRGVVRSRLTVDTPAVNFGDAPVHGQPTPPVRVRVATHVPVRAIEARADAATLSVQIRRLDDRPDRFDVLVAPRPELPAGKFNCELGLDVVAEDGRRVAGLTLAVAGEMQPEIRPLPARLLLGARPVGSAAQEIVVLQAPAGIELEVSGIETGSPDVHIEAVRVPGSPAGRTFRVTQQVTQAGDQRSIARFMIRRGGQAAQPVEMEISYRGEAPAAPGNSPSGRKTP